MPAPAPFWEISFMTPIGTIDRVSLHCGGCSGPGYYRSLVTSLNSGEYQNKLPQRGWKNILTAHA
jgi:hypothetical protein